MQALIYWQVGQSPLSPFYHKVDGSLHFLNKIMMYILLTFSGGAYYNVGGMFCRNFILA